MSNQSRNLKRLQKKARDRDDLDFCKENRDNVEYIKTHPDIITFCREHKEKLDLIMYTTNLIEGLPMQQRLHAQAIEKDLNEIRLLLLQGKVKALWVEPIDPIGPPKASKPIPIPSAKIEEIDDGYESEAENEKKRPSSSVEEVD